MSGAGVLFELTARLSSGGDRTATFREWLVDGSMAVARGSLGGELAPFRPWGAGMPPKADDFPFWSHLAVMPREGAVKSWTYGGAETFAKLPTLLEEDFEFVTLRAGRIDHQTMAECSDVEMDVALDSEWPQLAKFSLMTNENSLAGEEGAELQRRITDFLMGFSRRVDVVFGHTSYRDFMGGKADLEYHIGGRSGWPVLNTPLWRERLRGYSWLTIVPADLLGRLGGVAELRDSGAFHSVGELPNGSAVLIATGRYEDYCEAAMVRVWTALRPVLIPGVPRRKVRLGIPSGKVVFDLPGGGIGYGDVAVD